ncbi:MAG: 1-deoxy-D-xylulose-5-phosphate synthase [Clostridia bacterium]|nr:1-deoxy-D-xylulose-5-phosphate synthase [Clostridia bacterium]
MDTVENKTVQYLTGIHSPEDFQAIPSDKMKEVAEEIRAELIRVISKNGGHLASNLGVVELTMAIHRVFHTPKDHIIFDVGHQSYVHKMLTGRYDRIETIRQAGGLSGFTNRFESEHDCFGAGHSSTSLSAALGFAISDSLNGSDAYTVVVIGDGAYTGGMIHEALNNCKKKLRLVIIMNENEMSISKNIGRFAKNLSKLRTKSGYFKTKRWTGMFLRRIPVIGKPTFRIVRGVKKMFKNVLYGSNYFESMGLTYLGPIDGNDYEAVERLLQEAKKIDESVVVHLKTKKGKGYAPAENAPELYHGMSPQKSDYCKTTFSKEMGKMLSEMVKKDQSICAITAAMGESTGMDMIKEVAPERFFDVGIAEPHALTFAAGLCANGMKPFVALYSTFLQRGYDQVIHDIALQKLPCVLLVDRAGLNSGDGATHHGIFDVAFLSQIPNLKIYTPITMETLRVAMTEAYESNLPCAIRYPNASENEEVVQKFYRNGVSRRLGIAKDFSDGQALSAVIVTHGKIVTEAMTATEHLREKGISVGILLLEFLKPYDELSDLLAEMLSDKDVKFLFLEEEVRSGGMGMNLSDQMIRRHGLATDSFEILAVDDSFVDHREIGQSVYAAAGVDSDDIEAALLRLLEKEIS